MQVRDKLKLKSDKIRAEITAYFPGSQGINLNSNGEDYFKVNINGFDIMMSKTTVEVLFDKEEINESIVKKILSGSKPIEKVVEKKKVKKGVK